MADRLRSFPERSRIVVKLTPAHSRTLKKQCTGSSNAHWRECVEELKVLILFNKIINMFKIELTCNCGASFKAKLGPEEYRIITMAFVSKQTDGWKLIMLMIPILLPFPIRLALQ